jgi:hypothetical protein
MLSPSQRNQKKVNPLPVTTGPLLSKSNPIDLWQLCSTECQFACSSYMDHFRQHNHVCATCLKATVTPGIVPVMPVACEI